MLSQEDLFAKALMVKEPWFVDKVQFDKAAKAKAKARGYKRADTIKAIIYLLTGKLDFSKINPYYVTHSKYKEPKNWMGK